MKIFGRKKEENEKAPPPVETPASESSFYAQRAEEAPLNEFEEGQGRQVRRTSLHSPARRRETSNRTGNKEIFFLLFRTGLIVFLLAAGFFVLKLVLGKLAEPSEKEQQQWALNDALMERASTSESVEVASLPVSAPAQTLNAELIAKRLRQWAEAERYMRSAEALEQRGIDEEATQRLEQVLRSAPHNHAAQQLLMEIHMRSGNYAAAVPLCVRLLEQDSQQWSVKKDLLTALQMLGQMEACLVLADQMLEKAPNDLDVLGIAARAHRAAGNAEEALALFDRMLQNNSRHVEALRGSGAIYQERAEWQNAIPYYLELVRIQSDAEDYHELARCYARQGEAGKAIIFMGQAASLFGDPEVSVWVREDLAAFDPIRETVEYRSFADRLVGEETRRAIEEIRRREIQEEKPLLPAGDVLPTQPEIELKLKPTD